MRSLLVLLVLGCGGPPAFVPVTFTMTDSVGLFDIYATATKKLNPSCASNCELAVAIEDGGCSEITMTGGTVTCKPGGGLYMPFQGTAPDGGAAASPVRMLAPGAELKVFSGQSAASCDGTFVVPSAEMRVTISRSNSACSVSSSP